MVGYAWLITVFPLLAFIIIITVTYKRAAASAAVALVCSALALATSLGVLVSVIGGQSAELRLAWFSLAGLDLEMGVLVDPMSAIMFVVVSTITLLVQVYSIGYMHKDPGYSRFYAFLSLFAFSMLGLVSANNFVQIFIFWELVGLCSYLLIGFWYDKPGIALPPASAGMRAFVVTRIGDTGFLLGILFLVAAIPTFNFGEIFQSIQSGSVTSGLLTIAAVLLFCGAVGKSAQFPLHVWLPDAMEGPTPVSALIHAATMVAAGVYLVARVITIFDASAQALMVVAYIGGFTAFFAATIGLATTDFKRVIAYSTVSQLGYMMMALGITGAAVTGMFHLTTHAFFKALLFLAIGSVIHAAESQEMRDLGGLGREMKITSFTFLMGSLALAGIPPFAGFWSKDEIIFSAFHEGSVGLGILGLIVAFLTSFYIFRVYFATFTGEKSEHLKHHHIHESPKTMTVPLIVLAVLAVSVGWIGTPWANYFSEFMGVEEHGGVDPLALILMVVSTVLSLAGILLAWAIYGRGRVDGDPLARAVPWLSRFLTKKWYIDDFYYGIIVRYAAVALAYGAAWFDRRIIDGIVNGVAIVVGGVSLGLKKAQAGYLQLYALVTFAAVVIITIYYLLFTGV